jgi:hypothetical protein
MHEVTEGSFVRNCLISARADEVLFIEHPDGSITAHLDGYVICPIEELERVAALRRAGVVPDEPAVSV